MLSNYLKIAVRNLFRNKTYSIINIFGLSIGICVSVLILMFVVHERSYDRFHANHERIFRVFAKMKVGDNDLQLSGFNADKAVEIAGGVPQIKDFVRVMPTYASQLMSRPGQGENGILEKHIYFSDPAFFRLFSFPLIKGNVREVLREPFTMVISERAAAKYFGREDPVGKTLLYEGKHLIGIAAVAQNPPSNSTFDFDFVISNATYPRLSEMHENSWKGAGMLNVYFLLDNRLSVHTAQKSINRMEASKPGPSGVPVNYVLENIDKMHTSSVFTVVSNQKLTPIFSILALAILFLALFNYMSLTTASATLRAKEVGVRKVIGASRAGLSRQFYVESILMCSLAFGLAFVLVALFSEPFYNLLSLRIDRAFLFSPFFLFFLIGLVAFTILTAGSYPAFILSGFAPLQVLKGRLSRNTSATGTRRLFVVFQFTVSIALIISSLVVKQQLAFMQNKNLGFYKDQVLAIPVGESMAENYMPFREAVRAQAGVENVAFSESGLFKGYSLGYTPNFTTHKEVPLVMMTVDEHFAETLGLKWKIKPQVRPHQNHVLVNEHAIEALGFNGSPIGQKIFGGNVEGIVKDFDFSSIQQGMRSLTIIVASDTANMLARHQGAHGLLYVRLDPRSNITEKVAAIGDVFKRYDKSKPFEYYFLDDAFNETFKTEMRMSKMFTVFTALAIFVACMGLFGLVTFTAETRTKEIGIRKVLGASVMAIVAMLSKDFVRLVIISMVLAMPIAWYLMDKWLQDFAYRIQIPVWIYIAAGIAALVITLLTVSFKSIQAALTNPVDSLRGE
jgi:putative ABC transport system permease protein